MNGNAAETFEVKDAADSSDAVNLGQVANSAPMGANASSTTATSVTATTGTFTAPCNGWLMIFGYGQSTDGSINGAGSTGISTSLGGQTTLAGQNQTAYGVYATASLAMTTGQQTTVSFNAATTTAGALDAFVTIFFVPNP
jgi:hypothetical protein